MTVAVPSIPGVSNEGFKHLRSGVRYRVIREFVDFDRIVHRVGEEWLFVGHGFLPYDDGLSLFIIRDGVPYTSIRMQWRAEEQAATIEALGDFLAEA